MTNEKENAHPRIVKETTSELDLLKKRLGDAISTLPPREQAVLRMRFGLEDDSLTVNEVSLYLNVSEDEINQMEARALRRLRHPHKRLVTRKAGCCRVLSGTCTTLN